MRVERRFRIAGRSRGVAEHGGCRLLDVRPHDRRRLRSQQFFVVACVRQRNGGVAHRHVSALGERRARIDGRFDRRRQRSIDEDHLIVGVFDHVADLIGEEPDVGGVQDRTDRWDRIVQFQVAMGVPRKARHAVAGFDAHSSQRICQLRDACAEIAIRVTEHARAIARNDFAFGVIADGMIEDSADRERDIHHQARDRPDVCSMSSDVHVRPLGKA